MGISRQQVISLILIVVALPIFGYAIFGLQIPQLSYPIAVQPTVVSDNGVPITFTAIMDFTTKGSFSVGNSIHVKVTVIDSNVSDLLKYIGVVSFTAAFTSPVVYLPNGMPMNGYFNLTQVADDKYFAEGDLVWYQNINTHLEWLQPMPTNGVLYFDQGYWQQQGHDILNISPSSDTLAVNSNHTIEQLTWVLLGLSIIMVQPIITTLFPTKEKYHH